MPASKFTWKLGQKTSEIAIAAGSAEAVADSLSVNLDTTKMTRGDVINGLTMMQHSILGGKWPAQAAGGGGGGGGGGGSVSAFAYQAETAAVRTAATATGTSLTTRRARRMDRMIARLKACGAWAKMRALYIVGETEAHWQINLRNPGTNDLTKVGAPVFTANQYVESTSNANYYDTGIALNSIAQNDHSYASHSKNATSGSFLDCGARDSGGLGLTINAKGTAATAVFQSFSAGGSILPGVAADWNGAGWAGIHRNGGTAVDADHHGVTIAGGLAQASSPITETPTLHILHCNGSTATTTRQIVANYIGQYLTEAQRMEAHAAMTDFIECVQYGDPYIEEKGIGTSTITADVICYGVSSASLHCAYQAKKLGLTVAMVGAPFDETIWNVGGMVNSLTWIDALDPAHVKGTFRDALSWINTVSVGRSDTSTQGNLSPSARDWQRVIRRMLDPARTNAATGSALVVGQDIPIYMTGGITAVAKTGTTITSITTADGRVFNGSYFFEASYDGDMVRLAGLPTLNSRDAAGSGSEAAGGYRGNSLNLKPQNTGSGTQLDVDPYITPGVSASGRIFGVIADPGTTPGAIDVNGLQPLNKRMTWTNTAARRAPLGVSGSPPAGYAASKYEIFGRIFAACTAASVTIGLTDLFKIDAVVASTNDVNNGSARVSTDLLNSGLDYYAAGTSYTARRAIWDNVQSWDEGLLYWLLFSNDSRIPAALKTALQGYNLDPLAHLDPGTQDKLYWPKNAYVREPLYLLANTGYKFLADDHATANGSTPRSQKTVSTVSYQVDIHSLRVMDVGGLVAIQGALFDSAQANAGGTNQYTPLPLEAIAPDAANCTNLLTGTCFSASRLIYGSARMEPTMAMAAQVSAFIFKQAQTEGVAVQNITYSTMRTAALAAGDNTPLTLPQTN